MIIFYHNTALQPSSVSVPSAKSIQWWFAWFGKIAVAA